MGTGEQSRPPKPSKPASSSQVYHGPGAMPPPLFASTVASPTPHPYLWGSQHLLIPPYGMPVPYPGLYPPWGVYAHPNMTTTPNPIQINAELERKGPYGKDRASAKNSKATSGSLGKAKESLKATSGFGNDGASQSAESGTKGTSDASDENNDQKFWTFAGSKKGIFHQMLADGANAQSDNDGAIVEASVLGKHVSMSETNLNIGMDLWNASAGGAGVAKVRQNLYGASLAHMIGSKGIMPEQWIQIPNDNASVLKVVPQIDGNETVCDLELDDKEDNDLHYDQNVKEPKYGMRFSSEQELSLYYKQYAWQAGFGVIHKGIKKKLGGSAKFLTLACTRYGKTKTKASNIGKPNPTKKTGCKAKINAQLVDGAWFLTAVEVDHNHALCPFTMRKKFNSIVVEPEWHWHFSFIKEDDHSFIDNARHLRLGKGDVKVFWDYFTRMREMNEGFYAVMDWDDESRLRNLFWADARSRAAYEYFGDVIMVDMAYLTNRYGMPFVSFVGVNHHGQSILLGAGLLSSKDKETFVWLFETWLTCMNGRAPSAIITDQDRAMKSAISRVFPGARHRFCLWHIMRKLSKKLGSHAQYTCGLKNAIETCLYDSQTCADFDESWESLLESYNLQDNAWLRGLYSERTHWVPAYVKDTFWAGMSTTQQSESINAFFDSDVHSASTLKEFFDQFDNTLRRKVLNEREADFNSFKCIIPCISDYSIVKKFHDIYTKAKFKEFHEEFKCMMYCNCSLLKSEGAISTYEVSYRDCIKDVRFCVYFNEEEREVKCSCGLFAFRGILCSHALKALLMVRDATYFQSLPTKYILDRWRKDLKRTKYDDLSGNLDVQRFDNMLESFLKYASMTATSEDHCMDVMHYPYMLNVNSCGLRCEPNSPSHHIPSASSMCSEAVDGVVVKSNELISPLVVQKKGSLPSKIEVPIVEKVVKRLQAKTKQPSDNNAKHKRRKNQTCQATQKGEVNTSEALLPSVTDAKHGYIIGTQDNAITWGS
ncbi:protein FAR1-RELATED SEQUENCE 6-like isoform X2 [Corylus avellana]|uniref:protein FAR1-RELATED SEQUENCE 6-like isoform X2 n=1 Tax=Corylus avellana TaxID=13451 RepID=UPI00286CB674|nr:protein FAR1-RELATED SEQUENCE 6-like isoform X2 [Corylus avellana]